MIKRAATGLLAVFFVVAGVNHFISPEFYLKMMPPWLPWHGPLVFWSGVAEILGGLAVVHPKTRPWAGWGLLLILLAVFPANIHMAVENIQPGAEPVPQWALWARLPFQAVFAAWVWWVCLSGKAEASALD